LQQTRLLNDIEKIADGSATTATLEQYASQATSYIATSQGGTASDYAVKHFAVDDSVSGPRRYEYPDKDHLANDDYVSDGGLVESNIRLMPLSGSLSLNADNQVTYIPLAGLYRHRLRSLTH